MPWQDNPKLPKKSTTTERDDDGGGDEGPLYWCLFCVLATELSFLIYSNASAPYCQLMREVLAFPFLCS